MTTAIELLRQGRTEELWQKYCSFIDLSLEEFMEIQKRLLMEQIDLLSKCELGCKLLGDKVPTSVEEFRQVVPLTIYEDYKPYLPEKREDALPVKPLFWAHTTGRSGEYEFKWVPVPEGVLQTWVKSSLSALVFSSCHNRGDIALREHDKFLYSMAPPPYISGIIPHGLSKEFPFDFLPPLDEAGITSFHERLEKGFQLAFREGLDFFGGVTSVLVSIGERFARRTGGMKASREFLHPKSLFRVTRGLIRSKVTKRPMLPKDLWTVKGILASGTDTGIFKEKVKHYWGRYPLEIYAGTEFNMIAMQTWDYEGLTFIHDGNFLEFVPEEEHIRLKLDSTYQPRTLLLSELESGEKYEIVVTNFKGGAFVRYRPGDLIKIIAPRNEKLNIDIPQMVFESRVDDVINLAGFARLTEKIIWRAIDEAGIGYEEWTVKKDIRDQQPALHLYIELKEEEDRDEKEMEEAIHEKLKSLDPFYDDLEKMLGLEPIWVTILPSGSFRRYIAEKMAAGAELAQLKPPHINPSDEIIGKLLRSGEADT